MNNIFLLNDYITNGFSIKVLDILYLLSAIFALITIISKNPIVAVLFLIGLFVNIAGILILVGYSFMGLSYMLVYVGAVSILFLFILMLINIRVSELHRVGNNDIPLAFFVALLLYRILKQALP
jgi:NADH-ubiquinone oxidoreductase chain 6